MSQPPPTEDARAAVLLPCDDLDAALEFYVERLDFRLESIFPADAPRAAELSGHGVRLRLERRAGIPPVVLRLAVEDVDAWDDGELLDPAGNRVRIVAAREALEPAPWRASFVCSRASDDWHRGRAGMLYRDLIPGRQDGRVIASHIRIPEGGPVPDSAHHHAVRFQLIYCRRGEVRVVYEDQGEPFWLRPGDGVLQPPHVRHRVLECTDGLEVIELSAPAEHETSIDHELELPTSELRPERRFDGQRFVRHEAARASWAPWRLAGFEARDLGIADATDGLGSACVARPRGAASDVVARACERAVFLYVLDGAATLQLEDRAPERLARDDALVLPARLGHALAEPSADLELLEVELPFATG